MEVCTKLPISECGDADWFVNPLGTRVTARDAGATYTTPDYTVADGGSSNFKAGSTVDPPIAELQRFPRRVALRETVLLPFDLTDLDAPNALGINTAQETSHSRSLAYRTNALVVWQRDAWGNVATMLHSIPYQATPPA
jgi:hypothetical protein